jgi:lysylphosphatidylglycerol synthetase-like protein (DUF2156 family)
MFRKLNFSPKLFVVRSLNPAGSAGSKQEDAPLILRVSNVAAAALAPRLQRSEGIQTQWGTGSVDDPQLFHADAGFDAELVRRMNQFRQYGNFTMAFATLQPGMSYFEAHGGYLAYDCNLGTTFVLGDPVAPLEDHAAIIKKFVTRFPRTCFCQISRSTGTILERMGWFVNEFGADMELDLRNYDFTGPKKSKFRQAAHKIEREGYIIEEQEPAQCDQTELESLCASWLPSMTIKHESRFLSRPLVFGDEPEVRKYCLRNPNGAIVSFVAFDPICENGAIVGYSPAVKRRAPDAPTGAEEAITKFAIEQFRREGFVTLRLGLIPLYDIQDSEFREAWLLKQIFRWTYRCGNKWLFNFRGHADFKHRYRGALKKVYFATRIRVGHAWSLLALLRLCRIC